MPDSADEPDSADDGVEAPPVEETSASTGADADEAAADEAPADVGASRSRLRRAPRSAQLSEKLRTLDKNERRFGFIAAGLTGLISLLLIPSLLHNTITFEAKPLSHGHCLYKRFPGEPKGCHLGIIHVPADFVPYFVLLLLAAGLVLFGTLRSRRTLVAFTSLLVGFLVANLLSPVVGILLVFFGGWLMLRAWRLQRYGTADAKQVRQVVRDRAAERRSERETKKATGGAASASPTTTAKSKVPASKRYTPKAQSRRRR